MNGTQTHDVPGRNDVSGKHDVDGGSPVSAEEIGRCSPMGTRLRTNDAYLPHSCRAFVM